MQSLKYLYKIGRGPSSSHTMGPFFAVKKIKQKYQNIKKVDVILYNSLALTGEGHLTYKVIRDTFNPIDVSFKTNINLDKHPNTMIFEIILNDGLTDIIEIISIGGGDIVIGDNEFQPINIYPHHNFSDIRKYCLEKNISLYDYVKDVEGEDIDKFLSLVWKQMKNSIMNGLKAGGLLPGKLQVKRKSKDLYDNPIKNESEAITEHRLVSAYAFAVGEENAAGGMVVTAPTCGAAGILPAVLYYIQNRRKLSDEKIIEGLAVAGLIGNIIKANATISGAVAGCQAEVGSACSMAAAAHSVLFNNSIEQIEYAAEIAMEHHLGLTCDPIQGYVQIPCIERNAVAAIRAINASGIAYFLSGTRKISFDMIVETMYKTGLDMHPKYKETSEAGMAYFYEQMKKIEN